MYICISFWTVLSLFQVRSMWKMFVTHMYSSMWDEGKHKTLYAQLKDFNEFEEWYRSELRRGRLVQTLMQVSIQSLHIMLEETDMHDEKAVQDMMVLFRPLDGNVRAEVEHYNTMYTKDLCKRYQDN